jgi:hypothetical protein
MLSNVGMLRIKSLSSIGILASNQPRHSGIGIPVSGSVRYRCSGVAQLWLQHSDFDFDCFSILPLKRTFPAFFYWRRLFQFSSQWSSLSQLFATEADFQLCAIEADIFSFLPLKQTFYATEADCFSILQLKQTVSASCNWSKSRLFQHPASEADCYHWSRLFQLSAMCIYGDCFSILELTRTVSPTTAQTVS